MKLNEKKEVILEWIRLFHPEIASFDDIIHSDVLVVLSQSILGQSIDIDANELSVSVLCELTQTLSSLMDTPLKIPSGNEIRVNDYCQVLYVYSLTCENRSTFAAPILSLPPALQDLLKTLFDETIKWMEEIGDQDDGSSSMVASLQHNLQSLTAEYKSQEEALRRQLLAEGEEGDRLRQRLEEVTTERDALAKKVSHYQAMEKEHGAVLLQAQSLSEQVAVLQAQEAQAQKLELLNEKYKARIDAMKATCESVTLLQQELERLRGAEAESLQRAGEIRDLQAQLGVREQSLQAATQQLTAALEAKEALECALQAAQGEAQKLKQQLRLQMEAQDTGEGSLKRPHSALSTSLAAKELTPQLESELARLRKENELLLRRAQEREESQKNDTQASELLLLRERAASLEESLRRAVREKSGLEAELAELRGEFEQLRHYTTEVEAAEARESQQHVYYQECCGKYATRVDELTASLLEERERQGAELEAALLDYDTLCNEYLVAVAEAYSICTAVDARYRREVGAARERERALEEKVKKREALIYQGKAQLDGLQASLEEARGGSAALRKENEALGTKNAQLTRELFLARREKANGAARPHDEEYAVLLKTNEELTRRIQALEEGRTSEWTQSLQFAGARSVNDVAMSLDSHMQALESENRALMMSKSQLLQNKHILEQQIDEVVKENSGIKSELTRLKLHLQVPAAEGGNV
ncbi:hypothetical protein WA556_005861 [Blastocystis sp. ATCC 50177/Nand II]